MALLSRRSERLTGDFESAVRERGGLSEEISELSAAILARREPNKLSGHHHPWRQAHAFRPSRELLVVK